MSLRIMNFSILPLNRRSYLSFQLQGHLYRGDKKHSSSTKDPPSHPKVGDSSVRSWGCKHACAPGLVGLHLSLLILSWALQFLPILASSWARTPCTCSAACHLLPNSNRNGAEGASGLPNLLIIISCLCTPMKSKYIFFFGGGICQKKFQK